MHDKKIFLLFGILLISVSAIISCKVYAAGIAINSGIKLDLNDNILTVNGDIDLKGTFQIGAGTITTNGDWKNVGTFLPGNGTVEFNSNDATDNQIFEVDSTDSFYNLMHSGTGILTPGTNTSSIDINGSFNNSAGLFLTQGRNMKVAGGWSNKGTFLHQNNTVTLDGFNQTLSGTTTFYNLKKISTIVGTQTLSFDSSATQTIDSNLILQGLLNNLLQLRSTSSGRYNINLKVNDSQLLAFLDVRRSDASGGVTLNAVSSVDSGNNVNWSFSGSSSSPTPTPTPTGSSGSSSPTPTSTPTPTNGNSNNSNETPTPTSPDGGNSNSSTPTPTPTVTPIPGANINGSVVDSKFNPVEGIFVDAFDFFEGTWAGSGRTDSNGNFTLSNLNVGNYKIGVDVSGTQFIEQFYDNSDFISAAKIILNDFVDIVGVDFVLSEGNFIRGKATDNFDEPVVGIVVDAFDAETGEWINSGLSDGKGEYSITVPPGSYKISVDTFGTSFLSEFYLETKSFDEALTVEVTDKINAENINFVLSSGGTIKGQVSDNSGSPIHNIVVDLFDADSNKLLNSSVTDGQGNYSISAAPGRYNVAVEITGTIFKPILRENVVVKADFASPIIDFILSAASSIKGKITDKNGKLISNMFVKITNSANSDLAYYDISDVNGEYSIHALPDTYNLTVNTNGSNFLPISKSVEVSTVDVVVDLILTHASSISGNITDSANNPVTGLTVNAFDAENETSILSGESDKDGNYSIFLTPGKYKIGVNTLGTNFAPSFYNNTDWDRAKIINVSEEKNVTNIDFTLSSDTFVAGKITNGTNLLKEIPVNVFDFDSGTWINSVMSNEQGTYSVSVHGGIYKVGVSALEKGFEDEFYNNRDYDSADLVNVLPGIPESGIDFNLTPGVSISGQVTNGSSPIKGIEINAIEIDTNTLINSGTSDSGGNYFIQGLPAGKYRLWAFDPDNNRADGRFVSEFFSNTRSWNQASFVTTTKGNNESNIDIELSLGGSISGKVTDENNKGLNAVTVEAYDFITGEWANSVQTNTSGDYSMALPSDIEYVLKASEKNVNSTVNYFNNAVSWNNSSPIKLNNNENITNINFSLSKDGSSISGLVLDDKNKPIKGVEIDIYDFDTGSWLDSITTDYRGEYSIKVPQGKYRVGIIPVDTKYYPTFFENVSKLNNCTPVTVSISQGVEGVNFKLFKGAVINGTVSNESGSGLPGIVVQVYDFDTRSWINEGITDKNGIFKITVPPGKYRVMALPLDRDLLISSEFYDNTVHWERATPLIIENVETSKLIHFELSSGNQITGKVIDKNGLPLPNVRIDVFDFNTGSWITSAYSGNDGKYVTKGVNIGTYRLKASPPITSNLSGEFFEDADNRDSAKRVVVTTTKVNDINFTLQAGSLISGKVTDTSKGNPIPGIEIGVFSLDSGSWVNSGITDGKGNYFINVPTGVYLVRANTSGTNFIAAFYDNAIPINNVKPVVTTIDRDFNANFELEEAGKISGTVDNIDNIGIAGSKIDIFDFNNNAWINSGLTDIDGNYSINVPSGRYYIKVSAPFGSDFIDQSLDVPLKVTAPDELTIAGIVLPEGRETIIGTIRDGSGSRLKGIKVSAFDFDSDELVSFDFTDTNGDYILSVPTGAYRIKTYSKGSNTPVADKLFDDAVIWDDASPVNVIKNTTRVANFVLDKASCISGIVRDQESLIPLPGMEVHVFQSDTGDLLGSDKTDNNGVYKIYLPNGVFRIWAVDNSNKFKPQFFSKTESFDNAKKIVISGSDITGVNFELMEQ